MLPIARTAGARGSVQATSRPYTIKKPISTVRPSTKLSFATSSAKIMPFSSFQQAKFPLTLSRPTSAPTTSTLMTIKSHLYSKKSTVIEAFISGSVKPHKYSKDTFAIENALQAWSHGWGIPAVVVLVGASLVAAIQGSKEEEDAEANILTCAIAVYAAIALSVVIH